MAKQRKKQPKVDGRGKHPNSKKNLAKGSGFDKNPNNINRKGRAPIKMPEWASIIEEKGYGGLNKATFKRIISLILALPEEELKDLGQDIRLPFSFRKDIAAMGGAKGIDHIDKLREWLFGRPTHEIEAVMPTKIVFQDASEERQKLVDEFRQFMEIEDAKVIASKNLPPSDDSVSLTP